MSREKKEICIDARMITNSGIGTYIRSLINLLKDQYSMKLIASPKSLKTVPELQSYDLIYCLSPIYSIQEQITLPLLIPKCNLFWSPHFNIPICKIAASKRLVTIHDLFFLACPEFVKIHQKLYAKFFIKRAIEKSNHVITDSEFSLSEIIKYIGPFQNKTSVIHLGSPQKKQLQSSSSNTPLEKSLKYILFVGNLAAHKNVINLIRALDYLPKDIHLVLVGKKTSDISWEREFNKRQERIHLLGNVHSDLLSTLYTNAQALVHPSFYEGFGLTPLEAMSLGCPVVTSNIASLPEVCREAAIYINPSSSESISKGIFSILSDNTLKTKLIKNGFERTKQLSWDKCAEKHQEIIDNLLFK